MISSGIIQFGKTPHNLEIGAEFSEKLFLNSGKKTPERIAT